MTRRSWEANQGRSPCDLKDISQGTHQLTERNYDSVSRQTRRCYHSIMKDILNQGYVTKPWSMETPWVFLLELNWSHYSTTERAQLHLNLCCNLLSSFIKFCTNLSEQLKKKGERKILSVGYTGRGCVKIIDLICISVRSLGSNLCIT